MIEFMIGAASFFCGFAIMFAIHRVLFDYYDEDAKTEIMLLKSEICDLKQKLYDNHVNITVEQIHTYATPDDVTNLQFWED